MISSEKSELFPVAETYSRWRKGVRAEAERQHGAQILKGLVCVTHLDFCLVITGKKP